MSRDYLDFELVISRSGSGYEVRVLSSPAGHACTSFVSPLSALEVENFRLKISRRQHVRRAESADTETARMLGSRLFDAVFSGDVQARLTHSLKAAREIGSGLRMRLTGPAELSDLPWEYLYSSQLDRFLSVSSETPLVRYLDLGQTVTPLPITLPLRILAMIAKPTDYPQLDAESEYENLRKALSDVEQRGLVIVERVEQGTLTSLQHRLRSGPYHIVHFIGHGAYDERAQEGVLIVEAVDGRSMPVSARKLGTLLHDHPSLRLVVLNACEGGRSGPGDAYSGAAQALLRAQIASVIAMQFEISDAAAAIFAREFYGALADGYPVDAALGEARKAMYAASDGLEWGTPVLYTLAPDCRLFEIDLTSPPVPANVTTAPLAVATSAPVRPAAAEPRRGAVVEVPRRDSAPGRSPTVRVEEISGRLVTPYVSSGSTHFGSRTAPSARPGRPLSAAWALLAVIFVINLVETGIETRWWPTVTSQGLAAAGALQWLEAGYRFENPEVASVITIRGYSIAYFFLFPALTLGVGLALARRRDTAQFWRFALALTFDYLISLPFFLFFPVPERWAYPESNALLLSDLWSSSLIEVFRPASGLDNCFPSFHTSMTVIAVLCCYLARVRFRLALVPLAAMILVSTFALGIHWIGDLIAGTMVGIVSVALAYRFGPTESVVPFGAQMPLPSR